MELIAYSLSEDLTALNC